MKSGDQSHGKTDSGTVEAFLNERTVKNAGSRTDRGELYGADNQVS